MIKPPFPPDSVTPVDAVPPDERAREQAALAEAIRQSPDSVVITNIEGNIVFANDTLCRMTGYSRAELIGKNPRIFSSGKTPRKSYDDLWAAMLAGREWWGELHNRHKNGKEFVEFAHMVPLRDAGGAVSGYLGIKEDITERKAMGAELDRYRHHLQEMVDERTAELLATQRELEASRIAADAANKSKSEFLANMSHEIRTPMNAVIALSHLMLQDITDARQRERLLKISSSTQLLLALINDILDFSKIEAGQLKLENIDFALAELLDRISHQVEDGLSHKGLSWRVVVDPAVPAVLHGDPLRVGQVLLNFLSNALKFTRTGGVTLRVDCLDGRAEAMCVRFSVEDTGSGFEPALTPKLFRPFEQADTSTTREHGGTGLGLAICQRIADLMGGTVGADSAPGAGSVFRFEACFSASPPSPLRLAMSAAPLAQPEHPTAAPVPVMPPTGDGNMRAYAGYRLLLAEDNPINQEVAIDMLHSAGLNADIADNGRDALRMAGVHRYDLILLDVQMPVMDGLEAAQQIRLLPGYAATPILALTANAFEEDRQRCLAVGMNDHIAKPVLPARLYEALRRWLPAPTVETHHALPETQELDIAAGLRSLGGREVRYRELLDKFVVQHGDDPQRIRAALADGQIEFARRLVHGLKGVAATLGAMPIHVAAQTIDVRLKAVLQDNAPMPDLTSSVEDLTAAWQRLRAAVGRE